MCKIKKLMMSSNCTIINLWQCNIFVFILIALTLLHMQLTCVHAATTTKINKGLYGNNNNNNDNLTTTNIKDTMAMAMGMTTKINEAAQQAAAVERATMTKKTNSKKLATTTTTTAATTEDVGTLESKTDTTTTTTTTTDLSAGSSYNKYEIRGVAGEPNYKSVNLTWEVEFVPVKSDQLGVTNMSHADIDNNNNNNMMEPPNNFQIYYCELQTFGPQRCRMKLVNGTMADSDNNDSPSTTNEFGEVRHFAALIDNLRMATKYSFHIRPQQQQQQQHQKAPQHVGRATHSRADATFYDNEIESELRHGQFNGETIVIPTKGFSAHATQCLPHASEIEVETGPYFGGRIVVDGGNCGIKGNPYDAADKYIMRIDHKECGSMVKPETNTVETFITVQENLGIFTHSTRRFVVVCSYQSGMQTVRASFTVPGKRGIGAAVQEEEPPFDAFVPDNDLRTGRDMRRMRFVDKSELVLKDSPLNIEEDYFDDDDDVAESAVVRQVTDDVATVSTETAEQQQQAAHAMAHNEHDMTKYAKLIGGDDSYSAWLDATKSVKVKTSEHERDVYSYILHYISANMASVLSAVAISVIIISIFIIVMQRVVQQQQHLQLKSQQQSTHLPHKTLPRALQQPQHTYQCSL